MMNKYFVVYFLFFASVFGNPYPFLPVSSQIKDILFKRVNVENGKKSDTSSEKSDPGDGRKVFSGPTFLSMLATGSKNPVSIVEKRPSKTEEESCIWVNDEEKFVEIHIRENDLPDIYAFFRTAYENRDNVMKYRYESPEPWRYDRTSAFRIARSEDIAVRSTGAMDATENRHPYVGDIPQAQHIRMDALQKTAALKARQYDDYKVRIVQPPLKQGAEPFYVETRIAGTNEEMRTRLLFKSNKGKDPELDAGTDKVTESATIIEKKPGKTVRFKGIEVILPQVPPVSSVQFQSIRKGPKSHKKRTSSTKPSASDQAIQFEYYFDAYLAVQANISAAILPIIKELIDSSNSSIVHGMALSIWVDLTGTPQYVAGPFSNGMHALDQYEKQFLKSNNLTVNNPVYIEYLAVNAVLIEWYRNSWAKATAAANATGLLDHLAKLNGFLNTNDTSIMPVGFTKAGFTKSDNSLFETSNPTSIPGQ